MAATRNNSGVDRYLFTKQRTEMDHGGQRPVGGMECRSSKAFPQTGQRIGSFGKVGEDGGSSPAGW
jgi:hypothetical protein